jgi:hypothetical protein
MYPVQLSKWLEQFIGEKKQHWLMEEIPIPDM